MSEPETLASLWQKAVSQIHAAFNPATQERATHQRIMGSKTAAAFDDHAEGSALDRAKTWDKHYQSVPWNELPRKYVILGLLNAGYFDAESLCAMLPAFMNYLLESRLGYDEPKDPGTYSFENLVSTKPVVRMLSHEQRAAVLSFLEWSASFEREEEMKDGELFEDNFDDGIKAWQTCVATVELEENASTRTQRDEA